MTVLDDDFTLANHVELVDERLAAQSAAMSMLKMIEIMGRIWFFAMSSARRHTIERSSGTRQR